MRHSNWTCPKCGHRDFDTDQFRATGGNFARIFDVQNKRFTTVTCERCSFTEIYRARSSELVNVLDFLTN